MGMKLTANRIAKEKIITTRIATVILHFVVGFIPALCLPARNEGSEKDQVGIILPASSNSTV